MVVGEFLSKQLGTKLSPYRISEYPHWAEITVRTLRVLMYSMSVLTGIAAFFFTSTSMTPVVYVIVGAMLVFGLACLVGTLIMNYIVEWISLFFLTGGLSFYVLSVWFAAFSQPTKLAGSFVLTMLILALTIRIIDLTVYWIKNVRAARIVRDMEDAS
jgi:hypothetical protein